MSRKLIVNQRLQGASGFRMHRLYFKKNHEFHTYNDCAIRLSTIRKELTSQYKDCSWCISMNVYGPDYSEPTDSDFKYAQWAYIGFKNDEDILHFKLKYKDIKRVNSWPSGATFFIFEE